MKVKLDKGAYEPVRAHATDAGIDLRTPVTVTVPARSSVKIDTGVHVELPIGTAGMLKSKSGLNVNHDITCEGVIDVNYSGSIVAKLYNHGDTDYTFNAGDKIVQLVVQVIMTPEIEVVDKIEEKGRANNGFGSTGK